MSDDNTKVDGQSRPLTESQEIAPHLPPPEHQSRPATKVPYYISLFVLVIGVIVAGLFIFWTLQPADVLSIKNNPVPAKPIVFDGQRVVETTISFCKTGNTVGQVTYDFISSSTDITSPTYPAATAAGCQENVRAIIPVPKQAAADTYHIHVKAVYKINPIKTADIEFDTQNFTIGQ